MKAVHIMLFLLLFNLSISIVGTLNIYNLGVDVPEDFRQGSVESYESTTGRRDIRLEFFVIVAESLIFGMVAGSIMTYFTKIPADKAYVYSVFFSSYWAMAWSSSSILWNLGSDNLGVQTIVVVFAIVLVVMFMIGVMQMPVGGWKSYE